MQTFAVMYFVKYARKIDVKHIKKKLTIDIDINRHLTF